ncbi:MAG: hypothetical protein FJ295_00280 [Planctomycetes bacterium]|nr:hypothetical protein [Planctomycetota bacterium]
MKTARFAMFLAFSLGTVAEVHADFGPKIGSPPRLTMTWDGNPLRGEKYALAVLDCSPSARGHRAEKFYGFESSSLPPVDDCRWITTTQGVIKDAVNMPQAAAPRFRLAVWLPDRKQVFLSNVVDSHPILNTWFLNLRSDGSAELWHDATDQEVIDWFILLARHEILTAFCVTLAVESIVLGIFVARIKPTNVRGLFVRCLLGNTLTLPIVWSATMITMIVSGQVGPTMVMLGFCELAAVVVEAFVLTSRKAFPPRIALAYSSLANLASFSAGMLIPLLG